MERPLPLPSSARPSSGGDVGGQDQAVVLRHPGRGERLFFLKLSTEELRVTKRGGGTLRISFVLAREARVHVTVEDHVGRVVRTLAARASHGPGTVALAWNGRNGRGRPVAAGTYSISVRAANSIGTAELVDTVVVQRGKRAR